jgi:hypothetical protein
LVVLFVCGHLDLLVDVGVRSVRDYFVAFVLGALRVRIVLRQVVPIDHFVENAIVVENLFETREA